MTRIDEAAKTIADFHDCPCDGKCDACIGEARALDAAGHLAPDLPEVKFNQYGIWEDYGVTVYRGARTLDLYAAMDYGDSPETLESDEARHTAYTLLAAADHLDRTPE